jgi:hypothetical protein
MVQVAAQDQDEITDMDDDIISGCYVLDIGIHIPVSRLWIRADKHAKPMAKVPSGVLTGQPGIESSCIASSAYYSSSCGMARVSGFITPLVAAQLVL